MSKTNTHGLKMRGLRTVCGETKRLNPYDCKYLQINYNKKTGEIWSDFFCDLGGSWHTRYHDDDIITCGTVNRPCTMQELADFIASKTLDTPNV